MVAEKLKPLALGYAHEHKHYQEQGKKDPFSASAVGNALDPFSHRGLSKKSYDEFKNLASGAGNKRVRYFRSYERPEYTIRVNPTSHLLEDVYGNLINTTKPLLYAMDKYGTLVATLGIEEVGFSAFDQLGKFINHSSLLAGKAVACAGCLQIRAGRLVHIDNNSGHYQPTADHLRQCVLYLRDQEYLDLGGCRIYEGGTRMYYTPDTFINHPGSPSDWTEGRKKVWSGLYSYKEPGPKQQQELQELRELRELGLVREIIEQLQPRTPSLV